jgi:hypothetical protein
MESMHTEIKRDNEELDAIKNKLITHYHKVLTEAQDTRGQGLVWVIKAILELGSEVILSYLPNFLDEQAIKFLFLVYKSIMS